MSQIENNSQSMAICLWFDTQAEEAARFYTSIFKNSSIGNITRFGKEGFEVHGMPEGTAMTVDFELNGMKFIAINGGPIFKFSEAISIVVNCENQEEIDHYWEHLTLEGEASQCGWLKDKFGVSWQIIPTILPKFFAEQDPEKKSRVMGTLYQMTKFNIQAMKEAYEGKV